MNPIYKPKGRAKEYGDYAINIYTGCPHGCLYCYAPSVLRKDRDTFTSVVEPRKGIVEATKRQIDREGITGKLIHLCFTCDPYPDGVDTSATREIIKIIKDSGNHVQILTKNGIDVERDFDLLDGNDWVGSTFTGLDYVNNIEPHCANFGLYALKEAKIRRINTWLSCEPVLITKEIIHAVRLFHWIDKFKIGKLNYHKPEDFGLEPIDWKEFGHAVEKACIDHNRNYLIKDDLRKEMEKWNG